MNEHAEVIRYVATLVEAVESDIIKSNYQIATGKFEAAYELLGGRHGDGGDMGTGPVSHICNDYKYPVKDKHFLQK